MRHLNSCLGVRVAVSAWSAGVGQHLWWGLAQQHGAVALHLTTTTTQGSGTASHNHNKRGIKKCHNNHTSTTPEGVAYREDPEAAEGVEGEEDEDGEGHQRVHHLALEPPEVELGDGDVGVEVGHPALVARSHVPELGEEIVTLRFEGFRYAVVWCDVA